MHDSSKKNPRKKFGYIFIFFLLLSTISFFYKDSSPVVFIKGIFQSTFSVPKSIVYSLGKNVREDKVAILTKSNLLLTQKAVNYNLLKSDNEALKSQFLASGVTSQKLIATKIIGFKGDRNLPTSLIVNVGRKDGIKSGMGVIFEKNLVGKISEVSQNYSVVMTPVNSSFQVLAKLPETNANGLLLGKNDFMLLDQVVITDTLTKDGIVVTKGEVGSNGIGLMPDIIIGKITSISKNETSPFQSAEVLPIIDFSKLTEVFVISQM